MNHGPDIAVSAPFSRRMVLQWAQLHVIRRTTFYSDTCRTHEEFNQGYGLLESIGCIS